MKTLAARTQTNDKQVNHKSGEIKNGARQFQNEMKKPENVENKPGIFTRFVNWIKSVFSKKTEPNLESGATSEGNVNASSNAVLRSEIENTLSSEITGAGVSVTDREIAEPQTAAAFEKTPDSENVSAAEKSAALANVEFDAAIQATERNDNPVISEEDNSEVKVSEISQKNEEKTSENSEKSEGKNPEISAKIKEKISVISKKEEEKSAENFKNTEEKAPENPLVTVGGLTFETYKNGDNIFSNSGSLKALGKTVRWTAENEISLTNDGGNYFGSGLISFTSDDFSYLGKSEIKPIIIIVNNKLTYLFDGGLCYQHDGFKLGIGGEFEDLDSISAEEISLLNYNADADNTMTGRITIDGGGLGGSVEKDIVWFPMALFKGMSTAPKLIFGNNKENKLGFSLTDDLKTSVGVENVAMLTGSDPVSVEVAEDGKITYHLTEKYSLEVLGKPYENELTLEPLDIVMGQGLSEIKISEFDHEVGSAELKGVSLDISAEEGKKGGGISVKKLTYKDLTIENLSGEFGEAGVTANSEKFEFKIADKSISGSLEGFEWKPGENIFSVSKFAVSVGDITVMDNISLDSASVELSLNNGNFSFGAEGVFSVDELQTGCVTVSADELKIKLSYGQGDNDKDSDEKSGLSMSFGGSIGVKIGYGEPLAETKIDNFSYENGEFAVENIEVKTDFNNLISDKFSGTASLSAKNLKFSKSVELNSLRLGIENLAYNQKTLINKAEAEIIFKEDQKESAESSAKIDDNAQLDLDGNSDEKSGILKDAKLSIFLLENKKGAEITAGEIGYSFDYLEMNFSGLKGGFFSKGDSEFTTESAEFKTGKKLNDLLGIGGFSLAASDGKISSKGIEVGNVTAELESLTVANALNLQGLNVGMEFGERMTLKTFEIKSSASLGKFSVTGLDLKISGNASTEVTLNTDKIDCGGELKNLEITDAKGSFKKDGVNIVSANATFKIADTEISGLVKNLSWSNEDDFSVEELSVKSGKIKITDELEVTGTEITASVKNKEFSIKGKAALHIDKTEKGIVKLDETDLAFAFDLSSKEEGEDKSKLSVSGSAEGKLTVTIGDEIAVLTAEDIKYEDGEFSVGEFYGKGDLSKTGYDKLGGTGTFSVKDLKFKNKENPKIGAMGLAISELTYGGKALVSGVSVDIVFDENSASDDKKADAGDAEMPLEDGLEGKLSGLKIAVHLTDSFKGVKLSADKFCVSPKNFKFEFDDFSGELGSSSGANICNMQLGKMSVTTDLKDNEIAKTIGIEALEFTAENAAINDGKFTVGSISAKASGEINVAGFTVKSAQIDTAFDGKMELKSLKVSGELGYKDYISGSASVTVDENGKLTFGEVKGLEAKYGCFKGKLDGIVKENETVKFQKLALAKTDNSEGKDDFDEEEPGSIASKVLKTVPNIEIGIKELTFNNGKLKKPSLDDVSINKFENSFDIGKSLHAKVSYEGGEKGEFKVGVDGGIVLPNSGEEKEITILHAPVPIIPPFLTADFELGFIAGLKADLNLEASAKRSEKEIKFNSEATAKGNANFGFFGSAAISANAVIAKLSVGIGMKFTLDSEMDLKGKLGLAYDPKAGLFSEAFKVKKEETALEFDLNSNLIFTVQATTELKGLPMIFADKKLSHSWDLFKYNLLGVNISGSVTYDQENGKYKFNGDPKFTYPGKLEYNPQRKQGEIDDLGSSLEDLQNGMKKIDDLLKTAQAGVDPGKGSLDDVEGELGSSVQAQKDALMPELKKRIDNVFKSGKEKSLKCHILMADLAQMINDNADKMTENERNVQQLEKVIGESKTALEIVGYDSKTEFSKGKYLSFIEELKKLKEDETRLKKLAELEPAAVVNMFKAFKLDGVKSWDALHDQAAGSDAEQTGEEVLTENYGSQFKPKIYESAMEGLSELLEKKKKQIEELEKTITQSAKDIETIGARKSKLMSDYSAEVKRIRAESQRITKQAEEDKKAEQARGNEAEERAKPQAEAKKQAAEKAAEQIRDKAIENARWNTNNVTGKAELKADWQKSRIRSRRWRIAEKKDDIKEVEAQYNKVKDEQEKLFKAQEQAAMNVYDQAEKAAENEYNNDLKLARAQSDSAVKSIDEEAERKKSELEATRQAKQTAYFKTLFEYEDAINAAQNKRTTSSEQLKDLKKSMMESADISTAMVGFQGYISGEYKNTMRTLDSVRKKYGLTREDGESESPETSQEASQATSDADKIADEELQKRKENVTAIIDRLINDATEKNINDKLGEGENGDAESLKRHSSRLKTIAEQTGIVDVNMKGFGLPNSRDSVKAFAAMKSDNEKFQKMQEQLDDVYKQLSGFHDVIRQSLESWNAVNGLDFNKNKTASDFSESSGKVVDLIKQVDDAEEKQIADAELGKISEEVKRLGGAGDLQTDETSVLSSNPNNDLVRLGIE